MANLDKSTVRNEVSRLKDDFELLCADGKITTESKVLMNSMDYRADTLHLSGEEYPKR